jgi:dTDP-L-rhamnose 4-epimerase
MGKKVLVTGGLGFIGSFVTDRLITDGHQVRILDNLDPQVHPEGAPAYVDRDAEVRIGDVRDRSVLSAALEDIEVVIHCAAAVGVAQSLYRVHHYVDVNVTGTALLLELLAQRNERPEKLLVFTSMTGYGEGVYRRPSDGRLMRVGIRSEEGIHRFGWEPVCPETNEVLEPILTPEDAAPLARNVYALTKRYQEELALSLGQVYGFPVVCLRLFNVYGPRQSLSNPYTGVLAIFLSRLRAGQAPVVYEDGRQTRDFVSVHDVVDAAVSALQSPDADGRVLNIGSGIPRRIADCARVLARLMGRNDIEPLVNHQFRKGDIRHCTADIRRAVSVLSYSPRTEWEEGLAELIEWARGAPTADRFDQAERELRERGLMR